MLIDQDLEITRLGQRARCVEQGIVNKVVQRRVGVREQQLLLLHESTMGNSRLAVGRTEQEYSTAQCHAPAADAVRKCEPDRAEACGLQTSCFRAGVGAACVADDRSGAQGLITAVSHAQIEQP